MAAVNGLHEVVYALREVGDDIEASVATELARLAQEAARSMQRRAAKDRTELTASIAVHKNSDFDYEIRPGVDHAWYVEKGIKPGGKGLPRFFDPASASIVGWLERHPRGGGIAARKPAKGSKLFTAAMLALRDRYEGLAWHVRHKGVKAQPFVEPTAVEMKDVVLRRLDLAVQRAIAARPDGGATSA